MTFETDDRVYETSITTGTGTYTLDGAVVGFTTFAGMGNGNDCPYFATDDTNWEVGIGNILTGPNRLARSTILRSSNADAAVNWGAGTRKLRCGWPAPMAIPRILSKSVAGNTDVTLTQDEQRRDVLILTGALTGSINLIVDATPWVWTIFNNTTGAYTVNVKVTGQTGVKVPQGTKAQLMCDGVDVSEAARGAMKIGSATHDIAVTGAQAITGVGFKPSAVIFFCNVTGALRASWGMDDGTASQVLYADAAALDYSGPNSSIALSSSSSTVYALAHITSMDADGFTLTWSKTSTPTGTANIIYLAFR